MIQDKIPPAKPCLRLILLIPGEKEALIQDKIDFGLKGFYAGLEPSDRRKPWIR
jgi:hypothetical protein